MARIFPAWTWRASAATVSLDRAARLDAVHVVEIDPVRLQPAERCFEAFDHVGRAIVERALAVRPSDDAELRGQHDAVAARPILREEAAEESLVRAVAIDVGGVPMIDANVEGAGHHAFRLGVVGRTVKARPAHASEPDFGDQGARAAEAARFHSVTPEKTQPL
jgi:hypothetical protein